MVASRGSEMPCLELCMAVIESSVNRWVVLKHGGLGHAQIAKRNGLELCLAFVESRQLHEKTLDFGFCEPLGSGPVQCQCHGACTGVPSRCTFASCRGLVAEDAETDHDECFSHDFRLRPSARTGHVQLKRHHLEQLQRRIVEVEPVAIPAG